MCNCATCQYRREHGMAPFYSGPGCTFGKLTIEPKPWDWNPDICPADQHFIEYISKLEASQNIFHMGSGNHHRVGVELEHHLVTSITHCPEEFISYMNIVQETPDIGFRYKCLFGDIFQLQLRQLPTYNTATLFHLGELISGEYARFNLAELMDIFRLLSYRLIFYTGSFAYNDLIKPIVDVWHCENDEQYKSLRIVGTV